MKVRVWASFTLAALTLSALPSCSSTQEHLVITYEILLDGTSSAASEQWSQFMFAALEELLEQAAVERATVSLRRIGGERSSRAPFASRGLTVDRPTAVMRDRAVRLRIDELLAEARETLSTKDPHAGSDLLGLLWAVASDPTRGVRRIVVLSDGQQVSADVDLRGAVLDQDAVVRLVDDLEAAGHVPTLDGIPVQLRGLGQSAQGAVELDQARTLMTFWTELLAAAKADATIAVGGA